MNRKGWLTEKEIDEAQLPKVKKERLCKAQKAAEKSGNLSLKKSIDKKLKYINKPVIK